jgi:outer membrane protein
MKIEVIKKTRNYVVINKPAGFLVHASSSSNEKTLSDYLLEKYPQIKDVGEENGYLYVFDLSRGTIIYFSEQSEDILQLVIKKLGLE